MRNISFAITLASFNDRTKTVTRRLGWSFLNPGDKLMGCEKCQGVKKGELVRLHPIEVVSIMRGALQHILDPLLYGDNEMALEGFPNMTRRQFMDMFCEKMNCEPTKWVSRIEFKHL